MEKKLEVKDLAVSFRTSSGKVQAVRGISFDLNEGETLAIVGESGSGKSVTSKSILGILSANSSIEGGEIIYDGQDLLKISEEDFHKIRGDKIAMIFQDPMSSLNPIVKTGRQLTEAMILKGKARQRECRASFNRYLGLLKKYMELSSGQEDGAKSASEKCAAFDRFVYKHIALESEYNSQRESAEEGIFELDTLIFEIEKRAARDIPLRLRRIARLARASVGRYTVYEESERLLELAGLISPRALGVKQKTDFEKLVFELKEIRDILNGAMQKTSPNFFAMGYYMTFSKDPLPDISVPMLNVFLRKYLDDNFMLDFIGDARRALTYSANKSYEKKREAVRLLLEGRPVFEQEELVKRECYQTLDTLCLAVNESIDRMEIVKDSLAYTFASGIRAEAAKYFNGYADISLVRKNILRQIDRLTRHYERKLAEAEARNYADETVAVIDYLKAMASGVVNRVTKRMAKKRALRLMEEVGIREPRIRFNQYPFELSGGMRQRIVIAIALAQDPDILICDEPTTALDVTIQSQILELIDRFKRERNLSIIFITHDLGVVANIADKIAVMYAGRVVETGTAEDIFYDPRHPYTWALLSSMPDLDTKNKLDAIPGTPPNMIYPPRGDAFAARNKYALKIDFEEQPPMFEVSPTHRAATWLLHPDAPKVEVPRIITERRERMKRMSRGEANEKA